MKRKQTSKQIDEEMVCADALIHCLKYHYRCHDVEWEKEENDPPDFWFVIDGERFAGEVTSIVTNQEYIARCMKLKDAIYNSTLKNSFLIGTYVLRIKRQPKIPKETYSKYGDLVRKAESFICQTSNIISKVETCLIEDPEGKLYIKKVSCKWVKVGISFAPESQWGIDIIDELRKLIYKSVQEKRQKLEKKGIPAICPRMMLILYDAYGFCDVNDAQKALLGVPGYDWFHSVFWASSFTDKPNKLSPANPGRVGRFIYSANGR